MGHKFYEAKGDKRKEIIDLLEGELETLKEAKKFLKEEYGVEQVYSGGTIINKLVIGGEFPEEVTPDERTWKRYYNKNAKKYEDWYVPNKRYKEGKKLKNKLNEFKLVGGKQLTEVIGCGDFTKVGFRLCSPGIKVTGTSPNHRVFIKIDDGVEQPKHKNIVRISDIDYEKLTNEKPKAKKK